VTTARTTSNNQSGQHNKAVIPNGVRDLLSLKRANGNSRFLVALLLGMTA
jgi:hypothetical protein